MRTMTSDPVIKMLADVMRSELQAQIALDDLALCTDCKPWWEEVKPGLYVKHGGVKERDYFTDAPMPCEHLRPGSPYDPISAR